MSSRQACSSHCYKRDTVYLQAAAVPTVLTWLVIIANPKSLPCLLLSRYVTISDPKKRNVLVNSHTHQTNMPGCLFVLLLLSFVFKRERISSARVLAGLANSLLTGNVYMVECAPSNLVPSLRQIEVEIYRTFIFKSNLGL